MINHIIEFSGRNKFIVFLFVAVLNRGRLVVDDDASARCNSGSQRDAGDRLFALGSQSRHHGGSGHLPDRHRDAGRAGRAARFADSQTLAIRTSTSSSTRVQTSTGRVPERSSTCPASCRRLPEGVNTELGPDATGIGLGVSVRALRRHPASTISLSCDLFRTGFSATSCNPCRA